MVQSIYKDSKGAEESVLESVDALIKGELWY